MQAVTCCNKTWYHIVITWDSVTPKLYVNSSLSDQGSLTSRPQGNPIYDAVVLGTPNNNMGSMLAQFYIDEMIYKDEVMSAEEVQQLFASYFEGELLALVSVLHALTLRVQGASEQPRVYVTGLFSQEEEASDSRKVASTSCLVHTPQKILLLLTWQD